MSVLCHSSDAQMLLNGTSQCNVARALNNYHSTISHLYKRLQATGFMHLAHLCNHYLTATDTAQNNLGSTKTESPKTLLKYLC